jgi:hypothetical protein
MMPRGVNQGTRRDVISAKPVLFDFSLLTTYALRAMRRAPLPAAPQHRAAKEKNEVTTGSTKYEAGFSLPPFEDRGWVIISRFLHVTSQRP